MRDKRNYLTGRFRAPERKNVPSLVPQVREEFYWWLVVLVWPTHVLRVFNIEHLD
ncbi:MAG TPA: hypothetical protein VKH63_08210 [Candidatus Acidoferrum sp.]|jgi:hypothetical protein|nr:hypothetical protein [Candidatus Acidoferrum sp.]